MYKKQLLMIFAIFTLIFTNLFIKTNAYNYVSGTIPVVDVLPSASADNEGYIYKLSTDNKYYICEATTTIADKEVEVGDIVSGKQVIFIYIGRGYSDNHVTALSDDSVFSYTSISNLEKKTGQFLGLTYDNYFNISGDNVSVRTYNNGGKYKMYIKDGINTTTYEFVETDIIPLDIDNALDEVLAILPICVPVMVGFLAIRKGIDFIITTIKTA